MFNSPLKAECSEKFLVWFNSVSVFYIIGIILGRQVRCSFRRSARSIVWLYSRVSVFHSRTSELLSISTKIVSFPGGSGRTPQLLWIIFHILHDGRVDFSQYEVSNLVSGRKILNLAELFYLVHLFIIKQSLNKDRKEIILRQDHWE